METKQSRFALSLVMEAAVFSACSVMLGVDADSLAVVAGFRS